MVERMGNRDPVVNQDPLPHFTITAFSNSAALGTDNAGHEQDSTEISLHSIQDQRTGQTLAAPANIPMVYGFRPDGSDAANVTIDWLAVGPPQKVKVDPKTNSYTLVSDHGGARAAAEHGDHRGDQPRSIVRRAPAVSQLPAFCCAVQLAMLAQSLAASLQ
jgi:hypothetical protein